MFLSLKVLSQVLATATVVRAFQYHKGLENQFLRPRGLNATGLNATCVNATGVNATVAGCKAVVVNSTTGSSLYTFPTQLIDLSHSKASILQECDDGTNNIVVQDCSCSTEELATQAIKDAIIMVQAVKDVWNEEVHWAILEKYMGASCQTPEASSWINGDFLRPTAGCKYSP